VDFATLIGLLLGIACIVLAIMLGGTAMSYLNAPSMLIVIGGATAATLDRLSAGALHEAAEDRRQGAVHQADDPGTTHRAAC
jgi:chemotaxis protein MotA